MIPHVDSNTPFPFHLHWDADQLVAAMPTRLRLVDGLAGIESLAELVQPAANRPVSFRRLRPAGYLPESHLPQRFRIR